MAARLPTVLLFVLIAFCCWGMYGPVLHTGQEAMQNGRLRPFICVGIAYFLVGVIIPLILGPRIKEPGSWRLGGIVWSLLAGTIGALGSLGVIFAFNAGGRPVFVMPLVFGAAPVVNTIITMLSSRSALRPTIPFYVGIALVALGAAGVLKFKPNPVTVPMADISAAQAAPATDGATDGAGEAAAGGEVVETGNGPDAAAPAVPRRTWRAWFAIVGSVLLTAMCWGAYGPTLHQGQARMGGSRLRPFICVGMAYFLLAIVIPAAILMQAPEAGAWTIRGTLWSLLAGALGALGALGVIMAFTFGGKPTYVMPLVFGGAPVVNTATTMVRSWFRFGTIGEIPVLFLASLGTVIAGAVLVLLFAPKGHAPSVDAPRQAASDSNSSGTADNGALGDSSPVENPSPVDG